jgi:callose synthase
LDVYRLGNVEQTLSHDVYRLGHRLDFLIVYAFVWGRFYLALSGLEDYIRRNTSSTNNAALGIGLNQKFIIQLYT